MPRGLLATFGLAIAVAFAAVAVADQHKHVCPKDGNKEACQKDCPVEKCEKTKHAKCEKKSECTARCPVMGGEVDREIAVDYRGGKVFFCCPGCVDKFEEKTAEYATKANIQLVSTGQAKQKACPITGRDVADGTATEVAGVSVSFCCAGCKSKVTEAKPEEQSKLVFASRSFDKGFAVKTVSEHKHKDKDCDKHKQCDKDEQCGKDKHKECDKDKKDKK